MQRQWLTLKVLAGTMMLAGDFAQAGLSGRLETHIKRDNRQFQNTGAIEERLDVHYDDPASGLRSGLTLALAQWEGRRDESLYQLYLEKTLNDKGTQLSLGRMQRSDALGFYTLDGVQFSYVTDAATLTLYGGVPGRIEDFRSIDGDALYGFDLQAAFRQLQRYALDGRIGWQRLQQDRSVDRVNVGWRGVHQQQATQLFPSAFSLTGTYLFEDETWETIQLDVYRDFETKVRLRVDYETYEPGTDELTFKDRFYSLYARGRQSQFKVGYQFQQGRRRTWSVSGRRVVREFGGNGYGTVATMDYRSDRGCRWLVQLDRLELAQERANGAYFEIDKPLSSMVRASLGGVFQQQHKWLTGDNRTLGVEAQLERRVKVDMLPAALWFSAEASYIQNSRLTDEYRIAVRMIYSFDDRTREAMQ